MKKNKEIKSKEETAFRRNIILITIMILIGLGVLFGTSYAMLKVIGQGTKKVTLTAGLFKVEFQDGNFINLDEIGTMSDTEGKLTKPYTFTITNTGNLKAYYKITVEDEGPTSGKQLLNTEYLHYELKGDNGKVVEGTIKDLTNFVDGEPLEVGAEVTYELRLWLDKDTPNSEMGKSYQSKIAVYSTQLGGVNAVEELLGKYLNTKTYEESTDTEKKNMYVFEHTAGSQQAGYSAEELKDYRYIGQDPNNYVTFNNEEAGWRIIGVFTVENGNGKKEKRIKLIRKDPLQTSDGKNKISFDNKPSGTGSSTTDYGSNDWTDSRLMMLLNPDYENNPLATGGKGSIYWNQGSGNCPYYKNNGTKACDFSSTGLGSIGLNEEARGMIGETKWYLGGWSTANITAEQFYGYERGTTVYTNRKTNWIGKVGLMYPSDYGYATGGSSGDASRTKCLAEELYGWLGTPHKDCATNDWLYDSSNDQWAITPYSSYAYNVFRLDRDGYVADSNVYSSSNVVRPVVYLSDLPKEEQAPLIIRLFLKNKRKKRKKGCQGRRSLPGTGVH